VRSGLVSNLSRPSGNLTGVTFFTITLGPKRVELLHELLPKAVKIGMLVNPKSLNPDAAEVVEAAHALGLSVHVLEAASNEDIDTAFRSLAQGRDNAIIVVSNPLYTSRREQIVTLANYQKVPAIYPLREYVVSGGLVSYGASIKDAYSQSGVYAGRLLKGAMPSDLPVLQPTKFELVINLKTAKALGLEMPPTLLARADEVIE
jgi:putative ABC transport system substrate-binding protein